MKKLLGLIVCLALVCLLPLSALAFSVTLGWDASPSQDVMGYTIHYGTSSGFPKTNTQDAGDVLEDTVAGLTQGTMYYFLATAHDWEGRESGPSNEVRTDGVDTPDVGEDPIAPGGCYIKTVTP